MNTKAKGELTQAKIIARFLEKGFSVSVPFGDNQRYDIIVDDGSKLIRVQCKTAWKDGERLRVNACSTFPRGSRKRVPYTNQIEIFAIYSPDTDKIYVINAKEVNGTEIKLALSTKKNNNRTKFATVYEY